MVLYSNPTYLDSHRGSDVLMRRRPSARSCTTCLDILLLLVRQCRSTLLAERQRRTSLSNKPLRYLTPRVPMLPPVLPLRTCRGSKQSRSSRNRCPSREEIATLCRGSYLTPRVP